MGVRGLDLAARPASFYEALQAILSSVSFSFCRMFRSPSRCELGEKRIDTSQELYCFGIAGILLKSCPRNRARLLELGPRLR